MLAVVVLAAGLSRRMGQANKLFERVGGKPLYEWALDAAVKSRLGRVYLVRGPEPLIAPADVVHVHAPLAHLGQSHSLAAGIAAIADPRIKGALILLGDMPLITSGTLQSLNDSVQVQPHYIWRPRFGLTPGHPVYWPATYFARLTALTGDDGAQPVLQASRSDTRFLAWPDDSVTFDVDTPAALREARERLTAFD